MNYTGCEVGHRKALGVDASGGEWLVKAVVLERPGAFAKREIPDLPAPGPGEALVGVALVGVCGTDRQAYHGRQPYVTYPRILGHELAVVVLAVGDGVTNVSPGDSCAVRPYLFIDNLHRYLVGDPLRNVFDKSRGF
jgi:NADPH:quinone reductase-like Zn-dependent oxidoreductase